MPTSIEQVQEFLDEHDLGYRVDHDHDAILIGFDLDADETSFRDRDGSAAIRLVIRVLERGDFLAVFCPQAWQVGDCPHKSAVFEAIASIQAQYKLLRFDYDPSDGEIRPNIELPLEDSEITSRQFHRLIHGVLHGVQRFDGVIRHAMATGEVSFASVDRMEPVGAPSPEIAHLQRLAEEAGGVEELERLVTGIDVEGSPEAAGGAPAAPRVEPERPTPTRPARSDAPTPSLSQPSADEGATDAGLGTDSSQPKPVIRRIWEHFFGPDDPQAGGERRAS